MRKILSSPLDKRNCAAGLNAAIWPFLLFSPIGFWAGVYAGLACVILTAAVIIIRDHRRYIGCDWWNRLLLFLPGIVYWTLAIVLHLISK